jgi:hypothetical protein
MRNRVNRAFLATLITLPWITCQAKGQINPPAVSTLSPPFTLTYDLVVRHPNAKQQDEHLLNYKRQQYDLQVKQGTMTRQQAIQMLNALANSSTPQQEHHRIVLSCNTKGRLLYQDNNEEDHTSNFVLYDGKETYSFTLSPQRNILMNFYVEPNCAFWRMDFFPLPGLNLPYVPLLIALEIQTNAQGHMPQAKVKAVLMRARMPENIVPCHDPVMEAEIIGNILRPRKITLFVGANTPLDEWDYRDYTSFKNCWLSSSFSWTRWSSLAPSQVGTIADFKLVRASPTALSDQQFNPKTWLHSLSYGLSLQSTHTSILCKPAWLYRVYNSQGEKECTSGNPSCSLRPSDHHRGAAYTGYYSVMASVPPATSSESLKKHVYQNNDTF